MSAQFSPARHSKHRSVAVPCRRPSVLGEREVAPWRIISPRPFKQIYDRSVTICIAAACEEKDRRPAIVLCTDTKLSFYDGFTSSETGNKFILPAPGWCALLSGPMEFAKRLAWECGEFLKANEVTHVSIQKQLQSPLRSFKRVLMNEEAAKLGVSYDDYLSGSIKEKGMLAELKKAFQSIPKETSIILTSIIKGAPMIVKIENDLISTNNSFAVTGSGCFLATVPLSERNIGFSGVPVEHAAYQVYEAKRFSEKDPHVNARTTMCIQHEWKGKTSQIGSDLEWVKPQTLAKLKELYRKHGLQSLENLPSREDIFG